MQIWKFFLKISRSSENFGLWMLPNNINIFFVLLNDFAEQ